MEVILESLAWFLSELAGSQRRVWRVVAWLVSFGVIGLLIALTVVVVVPN